MYAEDPGRSVSRAAIRPPVHDSAAAMLRPASSAATWSSTLEPSLEKSVRSWRSDISAASAA